MKGPVGEEHIPDPISGKHKSWLDSLAAKRGSGWSWGLGCGVLITGFGFYLWYQLIRVNPISPRAPIYPFIWIVLVSGILVVIASLLQLRRKLAETRRLRHG